MIRSQRKADLVPQMGQRGLNMRLHLGVVGARMASQDCLRYEPASLKVLTYDNAARTPIAKVEAGPNNDAGLHALAHGLGQQCRLVTERPLSGAAAVGPGDRQRRSVRLP